VKRTIHHLKEATFLTQDKPLFLRHVEVGATILIDFQARTVGLICGQAVEGDQSPSHIIGSFVRQKVANQIAATTWNDATPVFSILLEFLTLKRVDFVADKAGDGHIILVAV